MARTLHQAAARRPVGSPVPICVSRHAPSHKLRSLVERTGCPRHRRGCECDWELVMKRASTTTGWGGIGRGEFKAPSTNLQAPEKHQAPNTSRVDADWSLD